MRPPGFSSRLAGCDRCCLLKVYLFGVGFVCACPNPLHRAGGMGHDLSHANAPDFPQRIRIPVPDAYQRLGV